MQQQISLHTKPGKMKAKPSGIPSACLAILKLQHGEAFVSAFEGEAWAGNLVPMKVGYAGRHEKLVLHCDCRFHLEHDESKQRECNHAVLHDCVRRAFDQQCPGGSRLACSLIELPFVSEMIDSVLLKGARYLQVWKCLSNALWHALCEMQVS